MPKAKDTTTDDLNCETCLVDTFEIRGGGVCLWDSAEGTKCVAFVCEPCADRLDGMRRDGKLTRRQVTGLRNRIARNKAKGIPAPVAAPVTTDSIGPFTGFDVTGMNRMPVFEHLEDAIARAERLVAAEGSAILIVDPIDLRLITCVVATGAETKRIIDKERAHRARYIGAEKARLEAGKFGTALEQQQAAAQRVVGVTKISPNHLRVEFRSEW